jgi:hypothetical protein
MHEMEGLRRPDVPCGHRGVRRPSPNCPASSRAPIARRPQSRDKCSLVACSPDRSDPPPAWSSLLVACGSDRSEPPPALSGCPRWVTAPDRSGPAPPWSCPTWPSGPDRSGPAPGWSCPTWSPLPIARARHLGGTCPAGSALIAQSPPARDCPASSCPDRSGPAVAERVTEAVPTITRLSIPRNPSPVPVNPRWAAVSRRPPRPGGRPPGRSPFPVTGRFLLAVRQEPQGVSRRFFDDLRRPQDSPQVCRELSPDSSGCPPRRPPVHPQAVDGVSSIRTRSAPRRAVRGPATPGQPGLR